MREWQATQARGAIAEIVEAAAAGKPQLIRRRDGVYERLGITGVALGMFEGSTFGAVETTLEEQARNAANIEVFEHFLVVDLVREKLADGSLGRCVGAYALDLLAGGCTVKADAPWMKRFGTSQHWEYRLMTLFDGFDPMIAPPVVCVDW